jgi:hypothetical protein
VLLWNEITDLIFQHCGKAIACLCCFPRYLEGLIKMFWVESGDGDRTGHETLEEARRLAIYSAFYGDGTVRVYDGDKLIHKVRREKTTPLDHGHRYGD